jgi:hypothetical protein
MPPLTPFGSLSRSELMSLGSSGPMSARMNGTVVRRSSFAVSDVLKAWMRSTSGRILPIVLAATSTACGRQRPQ